MKRQIALIIVCAALGLCVFTAGCSGPTASPTPSPSGRSLAGGSTAQVVTPSVTPAPSATSASPTTPSGLPSRGSAPGLTLIFFYRPTCPKCQATEPIIKQLETNYTGKILVQRVNDDDPTNEQLINQNRVSIVPAVLLLKDGVEVQRWVYPIEYAAVAGQIDSQLSAG